jgi:hypothetical protein
VAAHELHIDFHRGQYHWVHMLAPDRWKSILSYISGW